MNRKWINKRLLLIEENTNKMMAVLVTNDPTVTILLLLVHMKVVPWVGMVPFSLTNQEGNFHLTPIPTMDIKTGLSTLDLQCKFLLEEGEMQTFNVEITI